MLIFAGASAATSVYSGLVAAYPITVIEAVWALVALQRFFRRHREESRASREAPDAFQDYVTPIVEELKIGLELKTREKDSRVRLLSDAIY